jgi:hypothetical protein
MGWTATTGRPTMGNDFGITQADRERMGKRVAANDSQRRASEGESADTPVRADDVRAVRAALDEALDGEREHGQEGE